VQNSQQVQPRRWPAIAAVALLLTVSACGGSETPTASGATPSNAAATGDGVAQADQKLKDLYAGVTFKSPPTDVVGHQTGKSIWVIDLSLAAAEGALVAQAAQEAGASLGWKVTVFDGQFTPSRYLDGVRQAIAAKADGIFLYAIDCAGIKSALQQARTAGIKVAAAESSDCPSDKLFDGEVTYTQGPFETWAASAGAAEADWIISKTRGKAQVINLFENDTNSTRAIQRGFIDEMKTCPGCTVVDTVTFTGADIGPALQQKVAQAIVRNPQADVVMAPYDGVMTAGVAAAVRASGRADKLLVVAGGGTSAALDLVRGKKGETAGYCTSLPWEGYAGVDILNRLFQGKPVASSGIGMQVFDVDNNLPPTGGWEPAIDFRAVYKQSWQSK
jgi:ribose transport system substrate-binding protein